jgi:carboxymethylenebutenolidase
MAAIELLSADGHVLSAHRAEPEGTPQAAVVVIQEIFGVNAHIRSVADRWAAAGYLAIAPALFDRARPGVELDYTAEGVAVGRDLAWKQPLEDTLADLRAALASAAAEVDGHSHVGSVGFCYGGMLAAALACRHADQQGAAVAYYPSMAAQILEADRPTGPLMVHLGDEDTRVTPEDGRLLAERWPDAIFHRYPAGHGFNCDQRADHDPASSELAWQRSTAFLAEQLTGTR